MQEAILLVEIFEELVENKLNPTDIHHRLPEINFAFVESVAGESADCRTV